MYSERPCPLAHLLVCSLLTNWCPLLYYPYSTRAHLLTDLSEKEAPSRASVCSTTLVRVRVRVRVRVGLGVRVKG